MNYKGKWYSNLFGKPDEHSFVLGFTEMSGGDISIDQLYLTKKYVARTTSSHKEAMLKWPVLQIYDRLNEKLIIKIFNKYETDRTFF